MKITRLYISALCLIAFAASESMAKIIPSIYFYKDSAYFGPTVEDTNYTGAYYTGKYESPFKKYLGKTDKEIQAKLDQLWKHYFEGGISQKIYYDIGKEAYILDANNSDVRSEGLAWGMMIAVQTNHREEFDKIWNWAKGHHWHKAGEWNGYFAWHRKTDGSGKDEAPAPDAELYFMMSLLFAANRWDDSQYMDDAQYILDKMWSNYEHKLFNQQSFVVSFQPTVSWGFFGEPAYDLPAFIELFARWSKNRNYTDQWYKALQATRLHLYKSSHPTTGLFADYSRFDGTPYRPDFSKTSDRYMYDAERAAMNFGMDYYLFGKSADSLMVMAKRIIDFFEADGYAHARFDWDGKNPGETYTEGQKGTNAVAALVLQDLEKYPDLLGDAKMTTYEEIIKKNLQKAWEVRPLFGQYRYYEGMVHYLAMLHLCGAFKIWKPNPGITTVTVKDAIKAYGDDDPEFEYTVDGCKPHSGYSALGKITFLREGKDGEDSEEIGEYEISVAVENGSSVDCLVKIVPGWLKIVEREESSSSEVGMSSSSVAMSSSSSEIVSSSSNAAVSSSSNVAESSSSAAESSSSSEIASSSSVVVSSSSVEMSSSSEVKESSSSAKVSSSSEKVESSSSAVVSSSSAKLSSSSTAPSSSSKKAESSSSTAKSSSSSTKSSSSTAKSSSSSKNEKSSSSSKNAKSSSSSNTKKSSSSSKGKSSIPTLELAGHMNAVYRNGVLSVTLPKTSDIKVDVFDMMGNLAEMSRGHAAEHVVILQHLNRGFYVVRVSANSVTRVLKVQVK